MRLTYKSCTVYFFLLFRRNLSWVVVNEIFPLRNRGQCGLGSWNLQIRTLWNSVYPFSSEVNKDL